MSIGFRAAAKGAPEMAFWPTAVSTLMYAESPNPLNLAILVIMMFAGSMNYLGMRQVKLLLEEIQNKSTRRNQVGRNRSRTSKEFLSDLGHSARSALPDNKFIFVFAAFWILVNIVSGMVFLLILVQRVMSLSNVDTATVGLAVLPVLYAFVIISIIIWNV